MFFYPITFNKKGGNLTKVIVKAPAKAILLGEHAVVYDKVGISAALDKYTTVTMEETGNGLSYFYNLRNCNCVKTQEEVDEIHEKFSKAYTKEDFDTIKNMTFLDAVSVLYKELSNKFGYKGIKVKVEQERSLKGLGGSAATFVAFTKAYADLFGKRITGRKVAELANIGDTVMHLKPSGIDVNTSQKGRFMKYQKSVGLEKLDIDYKFPMVVVNSGETAETSEMVEFVSDLREKDQKFVDDVMDELDIISKAGIFDLKDGDIYSFGQKMYEYYDVLRGLYISTDKLDEVVDIARKNRAFGAKPTGAWGGGNCLVLPKDQEEAEKLQKIYDEAGFDAFVANLGAKGVQRVKN